MHGLETLRELNRIAVQEAYNRAIEALRVQESIAKVIPANVDDWALERIQQRTASLSQANASKLDPDDPEVQTDPIILNSK